MKKLTLAAALLGATAAHAQDGGLTTDDVRNFLNPLADDAQQAVENGNWNGVQDWLSQHVADDAPLHFAGDVILSGGPSTTFTSSLTGADLKAFGQAALMGMQSDRQDMVEEYSLEVRVMDTWQLPDGKVSAAVAFYESGSLNAPEGMEDSPLAGPFSSATTCALRMGGSADSPQIELANCKVDASI
ncbi:hypothetical protein OCGS_0595 [Oceaniovalibus guishaninsula JLT2003]|uniref:Uncharacterized protein n=1 Tax=Oceaniovalibus guishaninsula JLT2003 TaxID=1231392 RepID=K2I933_9RHOB|nr:hypothetical protein [Oceaniovalibus guishaninsula]EKE45505.1 hypothetical protein OCGS_0595 [Oceaniovalibus guishaninsula JLT2003]